MQWDIQCFFIMLFNNKKILMKKILKIPFLGLKIYTLSNQPQIKRKKKINSTVFVICQTNLRNKKLLNWYKMFYLLHFNKIIKRMKAN